MIREKKSNERIAEEDQNQLQRDISSLNLGSREEGLKPVPLKLKRFRVNVPDSMVPGDIMTIKLNGILTKILIATPTTSTTRLQSTEVFKSEPQSPSRAATTCSATGSTASSSFPSPSRMEQKIADTKPVDSVFASTDSKVPDGKIIVEAKPVIVVHAVFSLKEKDLKDQMIDEAMREIIQTTIDSGCNSVLGMAVSIKKQSESSGYLIEACGTPCLLMPAQVLLAATPAMPIRKRTSSTEMLPVRRP